MEQDLMSFTGNLGRDPEMRYIPSGKKVTKFPVATSRTYKNSAGDEVKETIWRWVEVWEALAESCNKFLKKGARVLVEGRLKPDPETGGPRVYQREGDKGWASSYEVTAKKVIFLSKKEESDPEDDFPF